jgi:hypothetical protein
VVTPHGYLINGLKAWKAELQRDLRIGMARYARLEGQQHPCLWDQGRMIELHKEVIAMIDRELEALRPTPKP